MIVPKTKVMTGTSITEIKIHFSEVASDSVGAGMAGAPVGAGVALGVGLGVLGGGAGVGTTGARVGNTPQYEYVTRLPSCVIKYRVLLPSNRADTYVGRKDVMQSRAKVIAPLGGSKTYVDEQLEVMNPDFFS